MRYSTEPNSRKYVKGYYFLSFARKFGGKHGKILMDTATKTGIYTTKIASKRVVQKTAEATGDFIENKVADKSTSLGKTKSKEKERQEINIPLDKTKSQDKEEERQEINISPEKRQKLLMT